MKQKTGWGGLRMGWSLATGSCTWKYEGKCWKTMLFASSSFIWCVICGMCVYNMCGLQTIGVADVYSPCVCVSFLVLFKMFFFSFLFNQHYGKNNMEERRKNHHEIRNLRVNCLFNLSFFQPQNCYC